MAQFVERFSAPQFFPLLDLRVDCLLFLAAFFTVSTEDSFGGGCLDAPLAAGFLAAGAFGVDSSALDFLDFVVSFVTSFSSGDVFVETGGLDACFSLLTAGVLGFFLEAATFLAVLAFDGGVGTFFVAACFLPGLLTGDASFVDTGGRPLPPDFGRLMLLDFLAGGGWRALGGGLFTDFLCSTRTGNS